jgi:hypothetical protein
MNGEETAAALRNTEREKNCCRSPRNMKLRKQPFKGVWSTTEAKKEPGAESYREAMAT